MSKIPLDDESLEKIRTSFNKLTESRGEPDPELDQYYVTKETSLQRALLVDPEFYNDKRIVFFGDMDLVSFNIGMLSKTRDLAVLDIDKRIPKIVFKMKFDYKICSIRYVNQDIRTRMIAVLKNQFDYIFAEPSMTEEGLELALSRAIQCAKKDSDTRIFISFDIDEEKMNIVDSLTDKMNLDLIEIKQDFNKYEYPTPFNKKTSNMYIFKVKPGSKETITDHYLGPLFYRECNSFPQQYLCKCGELHKVGTGGDFTSLEILHEKGCPSCNYDEKFLYNSSIKIE